MCRYGLHNYKEHYACFRCRKAFKRPLKEEVDPSGPDRPARCPDCGLLMAAMGLDFAAPRRSATKQWALVASLWEVGTTFHSCGCSGPGYRPRRARDYETFLKEIRAEHLDALRTWMETPAAIGERLGTRWPLPSGLNREEAIAAWQERIRRVDEALAAAPAPRSRGE